MARPLRRCPGGLVYHVLDRATGRREGGAAGDGCASAARRIAIARKCYSRGKRRSLVDSDGLDHIFVFTSSAPVGVRRRSQGVGFIDACRRPPPPIRCPRVIAKAASLTLLWAARAEPIRPPRGLIRSVPRVGAGELRRKEPSRGYVCMGQREAQGCARAESATNRLVRRPAGPR